MFLRFSDRALGDCKVREKPVVFEHYPAPPPMTGANSESRQRAAPAAANHRPSSTSHEDHGHAEPQSGPRNKPSAPEKPPPPRCPEVDSHESLAGSQSEAFTHCSANISPNSAFVPTHPAKGESEQAKRAVVRGDRGQGAAQHPSTSNRQPASSPPASSHTAMAGQRSPSPQFSPQRLADKPPVATDNEESNR